MLNTGINKIGPKRLEDFKDNCRHSQMVIASMIVYVVVAIYAY